MAKRFNRREPLHSLVEINVTPLIDLAFALLIIFMMTTPLLEQTIPLDLPVQSKKEDTAKDKNPEPKFISINAKGAYFWGKDKVSLQELDHNLSEISRMKKEPVIHLRADATVAYQQVIDVMDLIKKYNLTQLSFDTQVK